MQMEVFLAGQPWSGRGRNCLCLEQGDRVEVFEGAKQRNKKEWWGVRRLKDNKLGFVPKKCLVFDEAIPAYCLTQDYPQQRSVHERQLENMNYDHDLPPPPDPANDPEPDYDDGDDVTDMPPPVAAISQQEWDNILAAADEDFPDPPSDIAIPEPDYGADDEYRNGSDNGAMQIIRPRPESPRHKPADDHELVMPKKLPNPCLDSSERMALHKELLYNNKVGIDVLHRKSELRKALDKRQEERKKKEWEEYLKSKKTVFEKKLEEQATKLEEYEKEEEKKKKSFKRPDGTTVPVAEPSENKDMPEFYRVHSKIYKNMAAS